MHLDAWKVGKAWVLHPFANGGILFPNFAVLVVHLVRQLLGDRRARRAAERADCQAALPQGRPVRAR